MTTAQRPPAGATPAPAPWWRRLHGALMPDYNRRATTYWWLMVGLGVVTLGLSLHQIALMSPWVWAQIAIGTLISMLAGFFPLRVGQSKNSFAAGEIFVFLLLLIHGPAAATLAAAVEAFVGSWRTSRRWTSRIVSPAMAAFSLGVTGTLLQAALSTVGDSAALTIVITMVFSLLHFFVNTLLVTTVLRLKANQRIRASDLFGVFGWICIAQAGSATVAALLYLTYLQSGIGVLMAMVPLLAMMLATLHYFFRQQEAAEAVRLAGAEAQGREQELAARHVVELQASERRFHSAFTHASIGMALLSFEGQILQANPALRDLFGEPDGALLGQRIQDLVDEADRPQLSEQLSLVSGHSRQGFALDLRCLHRSGTVVWVTANCSFFSEPDAGAPRLILQLQDITARRTAEAGLQHLAFNDSLTGLPNRRRFHEHLAQAVARALSGPVPDTPGEPFAVMFLDFDRFKLINDSLGHNAGDEFLVQVSRRIQASLRPQDIVARLGGDEFGVLVRHLEHERVAVALADRLMEALRSPFLVAGTELMTSASIGITFSALGYTNPEDVLRDADTAMYKAKNAGKARFAVFDASLHTEVADRLRLEGELRRAIDDGRLSVAYQPLWNLADQRISGLEALVRWQHPRDGNIEPGTFLPIAEEAGLMLKLTDFVMTCAARQLRQWQAIGPHCAELTMNVNVSGHDLAHAAFTARVTRVLIESGVQPQHLCLELTENVLMSRLEGALPLLADLRRLNVRLAIDDFGTGYSSLSHLSTLPIDSLKIDRSFVARLAESADGVAAVANEAAVVRSIILLGQALGKEVVAEGIETDAQLTQLRAMGCRVGQGFLLARPMTAPQVTALLASQVQEPVIPAPLQARRSRFGALDTVH